MLYFLLYEKLFPLVSPFRVFRYNTFRTAFASLTALFLCIVLGPWLIGKLRQFQIGQFIREEGPKSHQKKAGTPTMGGVLIIISIVIPTLLWADLRFPYVWVAVLALVGYGAIGFIDDYQKVMKRRNLGITGRHKMLMQISLAVLIAAILLVMQTDHVYSPNINVPFFKGFHPSLQIPSLLHSPATYALGVLPFCMFMAFIVVGASNAVNLTDGLDGLAIGLMVIASGALTILAYAGGRADLSEYLQIARNPHTSELTIFCGAMTGASLGFLWYNAHPAQVFMGDVGSLALGGAIGTVAVIIKQELLLVFVGGVFVIEALSVMIQVLSFKLRGKRVFRMSPIHHHFELGGWAESKVIIRFWIVALIFALFSLSTLKLR
jgi:phospho-N-acetylmuramoyl-pentapeptide-transferase